MPNPFGGRGATRYGTERASDVDRLCARLRAIGARPSLLDEVREQWPDADDATRGWVLAATDEQLRAMVVGYDATLVDEEAVDADSS